MPTDRHNREHGFTMIELLIVIVVLGILASIVVFAVGTFGGSASNTACKTEADTVKTAMQAFRAQHQGAPPTTTGSPHNVPAKAGGMTKTLFDEDLLGSDAVRWYLGASDATVDVNWTIDGNGVLLSDSCVGS